MAGTTQGGLRGRQRSWRRGGLHTLVRWPMGWAAVARFVVSELQQGRFFELSDSDRLTTIDQPRTTTLTHRDALDLFHALGEVLQLRSERDDG